MKKKGSSKFRGCTARNEEYFIKILLSIAVLPLNLFDLFVRVQLIIRRIL